MVKMNKNVLKTCLFVIPSVEKAKMKNDKMCFQVLRMSLKHTQTEIVNGLALIWYSTFLVLKYQLHSAIHSLGAEATPHSP